LSPAARRALEVAYLLSTQAEEGRPLRFAFLLSNPNVQHPPERRLTPIATGAEAIRRLCLAIDPRENCWRISLDESTNDISVTGIARCPVGTLPRPYVDTIIEVDGIASVSIRIGDARAKYSRCQHFVPNAETLLPTLIPTAIVDAVSQRCFTTTGPAPTVKYLPFARGYVPIDIESYDSYRPQLESTTREVADALIPPIILLALRRMQELQHGGCLVLTASEPLLTDLFAKSWRLSPIAEKGPDSYGYNWAPLAYVQVFAHLKLAKDGVVIFSDLKALPLEEARRLLQDVHLSARDRDAGDYARLVAQLTVVDGIVVLSPLLEPSMFGGITSVPSDFTDVASKGARHRAAAYCTTLLPGSVALVVSQDGTVTAYRNPGGSVEEIQLLT